MEEKDIDAYYTLSDSGIGEYKDRGSKFIGYANLMLTDDDFYQTMDKIKNLHLKARHHCFGYQLKDKNIFRYSDDGEPSGTAGRPIYNQIISHNLVNVSCVVVRYFGGTKLGTSGLIQAYKETAVLAIQDATIIKKYNELQAVISFDYSVMGQLMEALKKLEINIVNKVFDEAPHIIISDKISELPHTLDSIKAQLLSRSVSDIKEDTEVPSVKFSAIEDQP